MTAIPDIREKVEFLSRCEAYGGYGAYGAYGAYSKAPRSVEVRETHMSWVFLTETDAWKLKKAVRTPYLDFGTPEARRKNCEVEVRLNRRLAPNVYLGVVELTVDPNGHLALGGKGQAVDWLVHMRRLPSDRMLDYRISHGTWTESEVRKVGTRLATFYQEEAEKVSISGKEYRTQLTGDLIAARRELGLGEYKLPGSLLESAIEPALACLKDDADLFDSRARAGKIVEGHGDLRPEHICLDEEPVIIDCLEFNRFLRLIDPASELTFLALECERLGAPEAGQLVFETYSDLTGDKPPARLLKFYKSYHACVRAKIAIWHLLDNSRPPAIWIARTIEYLERAAEVLSSAA